ncbi:MFS general substrate transporter [Glarea lozoyensis ATCC 20868]|uniref:MFS general substrate transporter n=1 Tax=Glarea lozoyensis (strain ATCC 20868 / MF5171) TaxID=1116229 RepID=S3CIW4_GLAL2|nr:MFS general substrate transporter [Glarea lozoyensis ATCC 20868]EPE26442.1 MFS general substrate transporter [Glarea lozoyensis ATCC 20868]
MEKSAEIRTSSDEPAREVIASTSTSETPYAGPALPRWRFTCLCIGLSISLFMSLLDTTIIATALFTIGKDLRATSSVNWVALSYTLSYLGCAVIFARISDIIGRRNAYMSAVLIFLAFSLGCGFAKTIDQLIALRVLQGVGGSGLYSLTFVMLPEITPFNLTHIISSIAGMVVAMAGILGPLVGGLITDAPLGVVSVALFLLAWPGTDTTYMRHAQRRSWKQLDILGAILIIAASVLVVFAFQEAGLHPSNWKSALFIAPLLLGLLCYVLLYGWEVLVSKRWEERFATMFPLRLIHRRVYMGYVLVTLIAGFPYFMIIYSLPTRIQVVNGKSQLIAGLSLLPMVGTVAIASTVAGVINTKRNLIFPILLASAIFSTIGAATLSTLENVENVEAKIYGFQVFIGLGFGLMVSTTSIGGMLECQFRDNTVAQGIIAQVRVLGGSIGIAASTAILGVNEHRSLSNMVTSQQLATLQDSLPHMTPEQVHAVKQAYSDAFAESMKVCAALGGMGVLASLVCWRRNPVEFNVRRKEQIEEDRVRREGESGDRGCEWEWCGEGGAGREESLNLFCDTHFIVFKK